LDLFCSQRILNLLQSDTTSSFGPISKEQHILGAIFFVTHCGKIPEPRCISRGGHDPLAIRAELHRSNRVSMPHRLAYWLAASSIPEPRRLILRGGHDPLAIPAELRGSNRISMPHRLAYRLAAYSIPEPRRIIHRGGYDPLAIPAELRRTNPGSMPHRLAYRLAAYSIPELRRIYGGGHDPLAVRAELHRSNRVSMPHRLAYRFAAQSIPEPRRIIPGGGHDPLAFRTELCRINPVSNTMSGSEPGNSNLLSSNTKKSDLRDTYHLILTLSWPWFSALIFGIYLMINVVFASLYLLQPHAIAEMRPGSFLDAFFFSVETLATVGYGHMYPETFYRHLITMLEIMVGLFGLAVITGLIFVRFSRQIPNCDRSSPLGKLKRSCRAIFNNGC
jgi:hypothetical protein